VNEDGFGHEQIRFSDHEVADLGGMPSARGQPEMDRCNRAGYWIRRCAVYGISGLICLAALIWSGIGFFGSSGLFAERLRNGVERAVHAAVGPEIASHLGTVRLAVDGGRLLALDMDGFRLAKGDRSDPILDARELSFGLRLWPLLFGEIELANARVSGGRIALNAFSRDGSGWTTKILNEQGLIDPDLIPPSVFGTLDQLVSTVRRGGGSNIRLDDITLSFGDGTYGSIYIETATATLSQTEISMAGELNIAGNGYQFEGTIAADPDNALANGFTIQAVEAGKEVNSTGQLTVSGVRGSAAGQSKIVATLTAPDHRVDLGRRGVINGDIDLRMRLAEGENKLEVEKLQVTVGRTRLNLDGAAGPVPDPLARDGYRFELVSNDSVIAPEDTTEQPVQVQLKLAGIFSAASRTFDLSDIRMRSSSGEASGAGTYTIAPGISDGMSLDLNVKDMAVAQVKPIWPWFAGPNARRWVMQKVFGGKVIDGRVKFAVAPGRLDDPSPLSEQEISGRFEVSGSRFDTAGLLPPVRDTVGDVVFAGVHVVANLASGTAYLESGRQVELRDGTLTIENTRAQPLIGRLKMKVAGRADALADLASQEPLNALRSIDLLPEDLSGDVTGSVDADIPLQKGIDRKLLDWKVALSYRGLDIKRPFAGQNIIDADGSILLQPDRATVQAKAQLNGLPAEMDIVQPLGGAATAIKRNVVFVLDDKTRARIAPGLNLMVSGTVRAELDASKPAPREVVADLTGTKLSLPWVGWSKGAGIPAKVTFQLSGEEGKRRIRNLRLVGKSFSATGDIDISGGFRSANMSSVKLNPGDDVAVDVTNTAKGLDVRVTGSSFDARALIKQLTSPNTSKPATQNGITLTASIGTVTGFNSESLKGVRAIYRGGGATSVTGKTSSGAPFSMDDAQEGNVRRISASTGNAGDVLRFLNLYGRMQGGALNLSLAGSSTLRGKVEVLDFDIVNEPKLSSVVGTGSNNGNLDRATKGKINTARVRFDRGFAEFAKSATSLKLDNAVLRGPVIATTFEGTVYDENNQTNLTGTFLPAYGINGIFGDIPILGAFLGGGENGGLIGVTYRLRGDLKSPQLSVNPLSAIAPGMFRKIFEY